ncbi:unnamed protein product [Rotaria sp. Silwood2]|nr:unnamed protein product [Rotaria sp. Silwood2]CAF4310679.1 unnamed protein product [Rotaria sp. Silwood2]CAF4404001.1 unnamed protein product [Rotaria sp. Silwood2]
MKPKKTGITKKELSDEVLAMILGGFDTTSSILSWFVYYVREAVTSAFSLMPCDPRYWKLDPKQFIPERLFGTDAPDANHHPLVFAPFGGGHRTCAGQELARLELKLIVIRFMLFVTFVDASGNNGGHSQAMVVSPKELAVFIKFD